MTIAESFSHTCSIVRPTSSGEDDLGNTTTTPTAVASGVACRFSTRDRRLLQNDKAEGSIVEEHKIYFKPGQDVKVGDEISNITFEDGAWETTIYKAIKVIPKRVGKRAHHLKVLLEIEA